MAVCFWTNISGQPAKGGAVKEVSHLGAPKKCGKKFLYDLDLLDRWREAARPKKRRIPGPRYGVHRFIAPTFALQGRFGESAIKCKGSPHHTWQRTWAHVGRFLRSWNLTNHEVHIERVTWTKTDTDANRRGPKICRLHLHHPDVSPFDINNHRVDRQALC